MIKIGDFSKLARTTVKTLRFYDEVGLFKPIYIDVNGYRYYDHSQLNDLIKILELRELDMPIEIIKEINDSNYMDILNKHLEYLKSEKVKKNNQINLLNKIIKGENYMYKIERKKIESNVVYYKHGVIKDYTGLFDFVLEAGKECSMLNPDLKCKDYCYIIYTANEYKEKDIELEYVEAVYEAGNESDSIRFRVDNEIDCVSILHKGKYEDLNKAYSFVLNYIKENNLEIKGSIREVYIHGCWDRDDESLYETELQVPIN